MKDELTQIIEEIKKAEGLTQKEVAERLGYEHTYLSQILNGKKEISRKFLEKVKLTFPKISTTIDIISQVEKETPLLSDQSNKIDKILQLMQQQSQELKGLSRKLNEIEQQQIVSAEFQAEYQTYLVSKFDKDSDAEATVVELQRTAFEKMSRKMIKGMQTASHSSHR